MDFLSTSNLNMLACRKHGRAKADTCIMKDNMREIYMHKQDDNVITTNLIAEFKTMHADSEEKLYSSNQGKGRKGGGRMIMMGNEIL